MDFGKFPPLRDPFAAVSSDAIIYRGEGSALEVLTAIRQNDPWKGCSTVPFGGYVAPSDLNPRFTAIREVREETGLEIDVTGLVGIYGPDRLHYTLISVPNSQDIFCSSTGKPAHIRPVVAFVFCAEVVGGVLKDTAEQKGARWVKPFDLVGQSFAFDHALALRDFLDMTDWGCNLLSVSDCDMTLMC